MIRKIMTFVLHQETIAGLMLGQRHITLTLAERGPSLYVRI